MRGGATFDPSGAYRYHLWREWDPGLPGIAWVMLNPSTADAERSDGTIRRCIGFARGWGYGRLEVVNLFAYRAVRPRDLFAAADPGGPENAWWLREVVEGRADRVLAWGTHGRRVDGETRELVWSDEALCLGLTRSGEPLHPLRLAASRLPLTLAEAIAGGP